MNIDRIAREAGEALHDATSGIEPPELAGVRRSRRRRSGLAVAGTAFAGTLVVVAIATFLGTEPSGGGDAATTVAVQPETTVPPTTATPTTQPPATTAPPVSDAVLAGNVFLLDDGSGPEICSAVMESLPPQCSGPPLAGLDWADVPWAETAQGVTWADVYIEARFVDGAFELAAAPTQPVPVDRSGMDFTPPCDPPQGGWSFEHGPGTSNEALEAAMAYVSAQPGRAGAWVYNLDPTPSEFQPAEVVIVAAFSGEVARHEAAIGELWSGPLCVFERSVSEPELRAIQDELVDLMSSPEWPDGIGTATGFSVDVTTATVEVDALFVTPEGQQWLDERYGPGVVRVVPTLQAVTAG